MVVRPGSGASEAEGWYDTSNFICGQSCFQPTAKAGCSARTSSGPPRRNGSNWSGGFNCFCDGTGRDRNAVGREPKTGFANNNAPRGWVPQCAAPFKPPVMGCYSGVALANVTGWSFESTTAKACDACYADQRCTGWSTADNRTATLYTGPLQHHFLKTCVSAARHSSHQSSGQRSWWGISAGDGHWYSTPQSGECASGAALGTDGCTWRVVQQVKYANASCIDGKIDAYVEQRGAACFARCGTPLNRTSECTRLETWQNPGPVTPP